MAVNIWEPDASIPVALKGGFSGYVVKNVETGDIGYFKIRNIKHEVASYRLAALAGMTLPKIEFAHITHPNGIAQHGAVSHFWGKESMDVSKYRHIHGAVPLSMSHLTGWMAFTWWVGYADFRDEHILWDADKGYTLIDYDTCFSWRYLELRHLVGPRILLQFFNKDALKQTADRIQSLTYEQIYDAFAGMQPAFYRFRRDDEVRFAKRLHAFAQSMPQDIGRYWERGVVDRNKFPQLITQDYELWTSKVFWLQKVIACPHQFVLQDSLWRCTQCKFYWPLQGEPDER